MVTFPYTVGQTILTKRSTSPALPKDWNFVNFCISYLAALEAAAEPCSADTLWRTVKLAKAGYSWRMLGSGREGLLGLVWFFFLEFSATKKGPKTCHVTKSTYHFPVCVPLSLHLHYLLTCYSSIKLFSCSSCSVSPPCSVSTCLEDWQAEAGLAQAHLFCLSPKTSVQAVFCHLLTQLSSSPALLWKLAPASPLWKCCQGAEWEFFSGELEAVSEQQCSSGCSHGARFAIISNYDGFIIVRWLYCLLHLFRWLLYGAVFQLGCPPFICQASKTT